VREPRLGAKEREKAAPGLCQPLGSKGGERIWGERIYIYICIYIGSGGGVREPRFGAKERERGKPGPCPLLGRKGGERIWGECVCVCVCVCIYIYIYIYIYRYIYIYVCIYRANSIYIGFT